MAPYDRAVRQNQHARGFVGRAFGVGNGLGRPPSFSVVGGQTAGGLGSPRRPVNPVKSCKSALDWLFPHITRTVMIRDDIKAALVQSMKARNERSEEHTSELQSLMRNSYAVFCLTKKKKK